MKRTISLLALMLALAACGSGNGTNPFDDPIDETDPNTADSKFLFNVENKFTMNDVEYDEVNDELVINNLPFDGPSGRYDRLRTQGGSAVYRSRQTPTTGRILHYAVFMKNEDMEVAAAAGADWLDFGYGGANVKRRAYNLPGGIGEYIYVGTYGGVRTRNDGAGLEIVTGSTRLLLDIFDFDEDGTGVGDGILEGAIVGSIQNRVRTDAASGTVKTNQLPAVSLALVQYDPETGSFVNGVASTGFNGNPRDGGRWEGFVGGSTGQTIGAYMTMTGPAEIQRISYEIVDWEDPATGASGTVVGYSNQDDYDTVYAQVDAGQEVGLLAADRSVIPAGATITSTRIEDFTIETPGDAREAGVILTEQLPTP